MPDELANSTRPGGEPLYNIAALSVGSRRLPRTSPRDAVLSRVAFSRQQNRYDGETSRWVVPGSRPLTTFVGQILPRGEYRKVALARAKAAPLEVLASYTRCPQTFRGRRKLADARLLRRHSRRHHDGVSHPVHDFFVRRNNGR
jgi:hypothetical protein